MNSKARGLMFKKVLKNLFGESAEQCVNCGTDPNVKEQEMLSRNKHGITNKRAKVNSFRNKRIEFGDTRINKEYKKRLMKMAYNVNPPSYTDSIY